MPYDPERHHRRSIRLPGYDYTQAGAYFITLCTYNRAHIFGSVRGNAVQLTDSGRIVLQEWYRTAEARLYVRLDTCVVMPNHFHGVLWIVDEEGTGAATQEGTTTQEDMVPCPNVEKFGKPVPRSLPTIVRAFKSAVTKRINQLRGTPGERVWQRNYYEHVVRDEAALSRIRTYIANNPAKWTKDRLYVTG